MNERNGHFPVVGRGNAIIRLIILIKHLNKVTLTSLTPIISKAISINHGAYNLLFRSDMK